MNPTAFQPKARFRITACMLFLAIFQVATLGVGMKFSLAGFADFRAFYAAGAIVRTGHAANLYNYDLQHQVQNQLIGGRTAALPFVYPIYAALPFVPLSFFPYKTAFFLLLILNAALLAVTVWIVLPYLKPLRELWPPLPWLLFFCFYPVGIALLQGQVSIFLLLVLCFSFVLLDQQKPFAAGAILALALMKFHVVLPIVLLFVLWRRWRFTTGFIAGTAATALTCLAIAGPTGIQNYLYAMQTAAVTGAVGTTQDAYQVFSAKMANLHGLSFALAGQTHWGTALLILASLAVLAGGALQPPSLPRAVVAALLVSYHLHLHDLTLLLFPVCLILSEAAASLLQGEKQRQPILLATALFWVLAPVLAWLSGAGLNSLMALAMLPLLLIHQEALRARCGMLNPEVQVL